MRLTHGGGKYSLMYAVTLPQFTCSCRLALRGRLMMREEAMAGWQSQVPGCFGAVDAVFAGHPNEEDRAWELLKELRAQNVPWQDVKREFRGYLNRKNCPQPHVDEQMKRVKRHMKAWLS